MNNVYFVILLLIFCAAGYYLSWRYYLKDNFRTAVLLIMVCGLFLRIYTSSSELYLHSWDERYHALVAKNLIQHPLVPSLYDNPVLPYDFRGWTSNHIWLHKQPLPLWAMAASMWLFGVNEIALRFPSIIISTLGIWITFMLGSYFFNRKTGYLAALFFSLNGLIIEITSGRVATDHIDVFFMFFIQLSILFSILFAKKRKIIFNVLAGISIGAAILCKWLPALIVVPVWLLVLIESRNFRLKEIILHLVVLLAVCTLVFLPWQLYIFSIFPAEAGWEASFNVKHITQVLEGNTGSFFYFLDKIRVNYNDLIYLSLGWFIWETFNVYMNKKNLALLIWILIPILFFSIAKTKMQAYILFVSPALFLITAEFYFVLLEYKKSRRAQWFYNLVLFLLIALPVRYTIERVKPFNHDKVNPDWAVDIRKLNERNISKGILFNYDKPIEAMFYTNLTVYPYIPEGSVVTGLLHQGYTVLINDDGRIPIGIKSIKGIRIEKLEE